MRGWLTAASLAARAGLPVSSHTFPELSVQLLALTPTGHRLEYLDHVGAILNEPIRVAGGLAYPPDRPGSGLEWDEARSGGGPSADRRSRSAHRSAHASSGG